MSLFHVVLLWVGSGPAQAQAPCPPASQPVVSDLGSVVKTPVAPCQNERDAVASLKREIEQTAALRDAYALEDQFWLSRALYYASGSSTIIDGVFGKSDLASASLMSVELVADALVVTKAVSGGTKGYKAYGAGSKYARGAAKTAMRAKFRRDIVQGAAAFGVSSGTKLLQAGVGMDKTHSQRMMESEARHFSEAANNPVLARADAILQEVENPSFSLWEFVPFVSPIKRLNRMFGADEMIDDVSDALAHSKKQRYRARRLREEADEKLGDLNRELGRKQGELSDCARGSNS